MLRILSSHAMPNRPLHRSAPARDDGDPHQESKAYLIMAAQGLVSQFLATFKDFPPRQAAASLTIDQAMEKMTSAMSSHGK